MQFSTTIPVGIAKKNRDSDRHRLIKNNLHACINFIFIKKLLFLRKNQN